MIMQNSLNAPQMYKYIPFISKIEELMLRKWQNFQMMSPSNYSNSCLKKIIMIWRNLEDKIIFHITKGTFVSSVNHRNRKIIDSRGKVWIGDFHRSEYLREMNAQTFREITKHFVRKCALIFIGIWNYTIN